MHMHPADGDQALIHIWFLLRVWLMEKSLVTFTGGTWFVCIDTGNDDDLILYLVLYLYQTAGVV